MAPCQKLPGGHMAPCQIGLRGLWSNVFLCVYVFVVCYFCIYTLEQTIFTGYGWAKKTIEYVWVRVRVTLKKSIIPTCSRDLALYRLVDFYFKRGEQKNRKENRRWKGSDWKSLRDTFKISRQFYFSQYVIANWWSQYDQAWEFWNFHTSAHIFQVFHIFSEFLHHSVSCLCVYVKRFYGHFF